MNASKYIIDTLNLPFDSCMQQGLNDATQVLLLTYTHFIIKGSCFHSQKTTQVLPIITPSASYHAIMIPKLFTPFNL